jgi:ATP phosphoribosyltransferase
MERLKIAIQKKGRLTQNSLGLLQKCGIILANGPSQLKTEADNFPLDVLFLRDDDIPEYIEQQVADIGIVGENIVQEKRKKVQMVEKLGAAKCRLSLSIPKEQPYEGISYFENKRIATSYPNILSDFLAKNNISADIEEISGSVEIAPGINLADAICDIVSTGSTLFTNNLKEVKTLLKSQAVLIANKSLSSRKQKIVEKLLFRMQAVRRSANNKYILMNAPNDAINDISEVLPGIKSPTVTPLATDGWSSLQSVIQEDDFWNIIDQLKALGAEGILVAPIEKMVL